jgi:hypothetical protein
MRKIAMLVALCLAAACNRETPEKVVLPRPFRMVGNVTPGMSVSKLQQTRPAAHFAPYVGYEEKVGSVTFRYILEGTESHRIGGRGVDAVEALATQPAPEKALEQWALAFSEYRAKGEGEPVCTLIEGTLANNGPAALWQKDGGSYVLLRAATGRAAGGRTPRLPPLLIWRVGHGHLPPVLTAPGVKSIACPR